MMAEAREADQSHCITIRMKLWEVQRHRLGTAASQKHGSSVHFLGSPQPQFGTPAHGIVLPTLIVDCPSSVEAL